MQYEFRRGRSYVCVRGDTNVPDRRNEFSAVNKLISLYVIVVGGKLNSSRSWERKIQRCSTKRRPGD